MNVVFDARYLILFHMTLYSYQQLLPYTLVTYIQQRNPSLHPETPIKTSTVDMPTKQTWSWFRAENPLVMSRGLGECPNCGDA